MGRRIKIKYNKTEKEIKPALQEPKKTAGDLSKN